MQGACRSRTSVVSVGAVRLCKRERKGEKERKVGSDAVLIPRERGGGPVRAPCLIRQPRFPNTGLPSSILLNY